MAKDTDSMSFGQAFAYYHDNGHDTFTWKGKKYNTKRADGSVSSKRKAVTAEAPQPAPVSQAAPVEAVAAPAAPPPAMPVAQEPPVIPGAAPLPNITAPLQNGHNALVGGGMDLSNVARLAAGMPELYPERPQTGMLGGLRQMGHDYSTWNKLRALVGLPPVADPNATPQYAQGSPIR